MTTDTTRRNDRWSPRACLLVLICMTAGSWGGLLLGLRAIGAIG